MLFPKTPRTYLALFTLLGTLTACTTPAPRVSVLPNSSGLKVEGFQSRGPSYQVGKSYDENGKVRPPDVPPRTIAVVRREQPLSNKEPRYFTPAAGTIQVANLEKPAPRVSSAAVIASWKALLDPGTPLNAAARKKLYQSQLQEIPWMNAGRCFHGKLRRATFPWGNAVMFLTSYVQGSTGSPVNNDMLVLVVQGLTHDGRHVVNCRLEIRHPKLPDLDWKPSDKGKKIYFSLDDTPAEEVERWLDDQPDDSFQPSFRQYEELLSALQIQR